MPTLMAQAVIASSAVDDLVPTLDRAFKAGGVHLVAVPIDYSENTRVLVQELRDKVKSSGTSRPRRVEDSFSGEGGAHESIYISDHPERSV